MSVYVPERCWVDYGRIRDAEMSFYSGQGKKARDGSVLNKKSTTHTSKETVNQQENPFISEINKVRHFIQNSLNSPCHVGGSAPDISHLQRTIEACQRDLQENVKTIRCLLERVAALEAKCGVCAPASGKSAAPPKKASDPADDDDDLDLFGDDDGAPKKPAAAPVKVEKKKKEVIAKSSVVLDIKPWDDETDMVKMEECVRSIEQDGLVWGQSKLVPVAYNVKKLQIVCVVEDEKVSIEELQEKIEGFEDYVQSVDVAAFNKI